MSTNQTSKLGLILNTRPAYHHERFHETFGELPWAIYDCPLTTAQPISSMVPGPDDFDSIIFTSQVGVSMFWYDPRWQRKRVFTVGVATGEAAVQAGYSDVISTGANVDDLRRFLNSTPFTKAIYPSAEDVSAELDKEFPGKVERVPIYRMAARADLPQQLVQHMRQMRAVAPLFSRRSAVIFADLLKKAGITKENSAIWATGISPDVFTDVDGPWQRWTAAPQPTLPQMVAVTDMAISRLSI